MDKAKRRNPSPATIPSKLCRADEELNDSDAELDQFIANNCHNWSSNCDTRPSGLSSQLDHTSSTSTSNSTPSPQRSFFEYFDKEELVVDCVLPILTLLPIQDIILSISRVCKKFNELTRHHKFIKYKKLFFKYLARNKNPAINQEIQTLLATAKIEDVQTCILRSLAYLNEFCKITIQETIWKVLEKQRSFAAVKEFLENKMSKHCGLPVNRIKVWVYVGAMVFLLDNPTEIASLIADLICGGVEVDDVTECLYCLSTLLLACHRKFKLAPRHFYNIITAINFYENKIPKFMTGSGPLNLTPEQKRIIGYDLKKGEVARIIAFAGTGKTSTLLEYVKARPHLKFLMLMFNKAVCQETKGKFERLGLNGECRTTHSLAYSMLNVPLIYGHKMSKPLTVGGVLQSGVLQELKECGINMYTRVRLTIDTLKNYMLSASTDDFVSEKFAPDFYLEKKTERGISGVQRVKLENEHKLSLARGAHILWRAMCDQGNHKIHMQHDGYLKLFQLACRGTLTELTQFNGLKMDGFDIMLVDEAQDMNPSTLDALQCQHVSTMFVGDPHQQIYAFRGAVDALQVILKHNPNLTTFYLTTSFRFGHNIAYLANCWLESKKKLEGKLLIGSDRTSFLDGNIPEDTQLCYICRTNQRVFDLCVLLINTQTLPRPNFHVVGGLGHFNFSDILDIYSLFFSKTKEPETRNIKNLFLRKFADIEGLKGYAIKHNDGELEARIQIVKRYNHKVYPCTSSSNNQSAKC